MAEKKTDKSKSTNPANEGSDEIVQDDVIATIHVLKNKKHVKKRVVVRNTKNIENGR